jgi:hypothetical protein
MTLYSAYNNCIYPFIINIIIIIYIFTSPILWIDIIIMYITIILGQLVHFVLGSFGGNWYKKKVFLTGTGTRPICKVPISKIAACLMYIFICLLIRLLLI